MDNDLSLAFNEMIVPTPAKKASVDCHYVTNEDVLDVTNENVLDVGDGESFTPDFLTNRL